LGKRNGARNWQRNRQTNGTNYCRRTSKFIGDLSLFRTALRLRLRIRLRLNWQRQSDPNRSVVPCSGPPAQTRSATRLALGELRFLASFAQAYLLTLNGTRVPSEQSRLAHRASKRLIVINKRTGNSMTNRSGLTGTTAA